MVWKSLLKKRINICPINDDGGRKPCIHKHHRAGSGQAYQDSQYAVDATLDTEYRSSYCRNYAPNYPRQDQQQQQQHHQQQHQYRFQSLEQYMSQCQDQCDLLRQQQQFSYTPQWQQQCQCSDKLWDQQQQQTGGHYPHQKQLQPTGNPYEFQLHEPTPAPVVDKHYRGAHYKPGHSLGVQVQEEIARTRETSDGPVRITCEDDMSNCYVPLYRYKDWVQRPEIEVWRDCNTSSLICRMPDAPTQHWDFYNEVRMNRPAQKQWPMYGTCRVLPIPRDTDIENVSACGRYAGGCNNYERNRFQQPAFQYANMCRC
ncbi:hypothetical protein ElyMa_002156900 [Elysia marginata]|uniref:Spaetzle domain-containing protein n=1 Tax=Elysia marginata TaxID=1093978 RepID=A0AAV4FMF8_9GAST|nr:hypothetical protein ElyMa_002156900 [Elysia marginata]